MKRFVSKIEKFFANTPELKSLMFWFGSKDEFYVNSSDLTINGVYIVNLPGQQEIEEIGLCIHDYVNPLAAFLETRDSTAKKSMLSIKNKLLKIQKDKLKNDPLVNVTDKISIYLENLNKDLDATTRKKIFKYLGGEDCDIYHDMIVEFVRIDTGIIHKSKRQPVYG